MRFRAFLGFVLLLSGCATHQTGVSSYEFIEPKAFENPLPTIDDKFESSTLIVKRDIGAYASLLPAKIYIDGLFLTNIKEGQYIELKVEPGSHYLLLRTNGLGLLPFSHELPIDVTAGSKYYYRIHPGWPDGMQITESPDWNTTIQGTAIRGLRSPDERGQTKVILDDIRALYHVGDTHAWEHDGLFTLRSFSTSGLESVLLDREELALLGENIIMRLLALNKRFSEWPCPITRPVILESAAISMFLCEKHPESGLIPVGSVELRARFFQWLFYLTSTVQSKLMIYFYPGRHSENMSGAEQVRRAQDARLSEMFAIIDAELQGREFLLGTDLSLCDYFLFMLFAWADTISAPPMSFKNLNRYPRSMVLRPEIFRVCRHENLGLNPYG